MYKPKSMYKFAHPEKAESLIFVFCGCFFFSFFLSKAFISHTAKEENKATVKYKVCVYQNPANEANCRDKEYSWESLSPAIKGVVA